MESSIQPEIISRVADEPNVVAATEEQTSELTDAIKEHELQQEYQMAVIYSTSLEEFPPVKSFPVVQKEAAAQLCELLEENHMLSLKLKHMEKMLSSSCDYLAQKWIDDVRPPFRASSPCASENGDDDVEPSELRYWYDQMKRYEEKYQRAVQNAPVAVKTDLLPNGQLFFDSSWKREGFDEELVFYTESRDHHLKISINSNGTELAASSSSLHMEKLTELVEDCLRRKLSAYVLCRNIWTLFSATFVKD